MTDMEKTLTTGEFSEKTGISTSTITQMLRDGRIRGEKRSGKWAIHAGALEIVLTSSKEKTATAPEKPEAVPFPSHISKGHYDVKTFAEITYLTEKGVRQWLACGRLSGSIDADGNQTVDAENLERPELRHLIRD